MPTCQQCKNTWSWKQTFRNSLRITGVMTCPICQEKQYVTPKTRNITTLVTFLLIILYFGLYRFTGLSITAAILIALCFIFVTMVLYPFWLTVSNEEKVF